VQSYSLPQGTQGSLVSKLDAVKTSLGLNSQIQAKNQLKAFINEVNAQRGKKISNSQADALITAAKSIFNGD
jgi:hypothetical protein